MEQAARVVRAEDAQTEKRSLKDIGEQLQGLADYFPGRIDKMPPKKVKKGDHVFVRAIVNAVHQFGDISVSLAKPASLPQSPTTTRVGPDDVEHLDRQSRDKEDKD
jgi:hypothetical protein